MRIWSGESWRSPAIPKSNFEIDDLKNRGTNWLTSAKRCVYLLSLKGTDHMNENLNLKPGVPSACNLSDGCNTILKLASMESDRKALSRMSQQTRSAVMVEVSSVMQYLNDNMDVLKASISLSDSLLFSRAVALIYSALIQKEPSVSDFSADVDTEFWDSEGEV